MRYWIIYNLEIILKRHCTFCTYHIMIQIRTIWITKMGKFYMKIILKKDGTWQCNNSDMKIGLKRIVLDKWLLDLYSTTCLLCMTNSFSIFMIKSRKLRSFNSCMYYANEKLWIVKINWKGQYPFHWHLL